MRFTRSQLVLCEGATVPDLVGSGCKLLFVGTNPGLWTAASGIHFAHPSNRFYPALVLAGILDRLIDVNPTAPDVPITDDRRDGGENPTSSRYPRLHGATTIETEVTRATQIRDADRRQLVECGVGITNLVPSATAKASQLSTEELRAGRIRLVSAVDTHRPNLVAVAGITAYRTAFGYPKAQMGRQSQPIGNAIAWVVPNPSGLNAHETIESLAVHYRAAAMAAGVLA